MFIHFGLELSFLFKLLLNYVLYVLYFHLVSLEYLNYTSFMGLFSTRSKLSVFYSANSSLLLFWSHINNFGLLLLIITSLHESRIKNSSFFISINAIIVTLRKDQIINVALTRKKSNTCLSKLLNVVYIYILLILIPNSKKNMMIVAG